MEFKRQNIVLDNGIKIDVKMCENYTCKFCGVKATACNFFGSYCIQIFAPHKGECKAFNEKESDYSNQYTGFVNNCTTCKYQGSDSTCLFKAEE